jgi:hypothetical protein
LEHLACPFQSDITAVGATPDQSNCFVIKARRSITSANRVENTALYCYRIVDFK